MTDTHPVIYARTVELLRDLSVNHAAGAAEICAPVVAEGPGAVASIDELASLLARLEDVGIIALSRLAQETDDATAFAAIEEADALWLRAVVLSRAYETTRPLQ